MRTIYIKLLNKKKILILSLLILLIITIIAITALYLSKKEVRDWVDINIFRKNLTEEDAQTISLNTDKSNQIHVYGKYIAILNDKSVTLYNAYGEKIKSIEIGINTGLFDSANKYLAIAEKEGNEICLILDKTYLWGESLEGQILQIHVNRNGYVAVVSTDLTHKSILTVFNSEGNKLFASYFASTRIVDVSISNDNKYIAFGELDTTGAIIQSNIKIISVQNAQNDEENAIIYTYNAEAGRLITNVEYQEKGQIAFTYENGVSIIKDETYSEKIKIEKENITYISGKLKNHAIFVEEENAGLFKSISNIHILNTSDNQEIVYRIDEIAKEIYTKGNIIVVNAGTEIYFLNTTGWLLKKYSATQEVTNVKFSDELATIIYKDKVIIIEL